MRWLTLLLVVGTVTPGATEMLFLSTPGDPYGAEEIEGLTLTSDGHLIMAGAFEDTMENVNALIVETDLAGNILWAKTYGGDSTDMWIEIKQTADGGFIAAGFTSSFGATSDDFWVVKMDANGNIQWEKRYGGSGVEQAWSVDMDGDDYLVVGGTDSFGAGLTDIWVLKLDPNGDVIWQKTYGRSGEDAPGGQYDEYVAKGLVDQDGKYIIASNNDLNGGDFWVARVNGADGSLMWAKSYGDTDEDGMWSLTESVNGGYFVSGLFTNPSLMDGNSWGVYLDPSGNIIWQKVFGVPNQWDEALSVTATVDGGALFGAYGEQGSSDWFAALIQVEANGDLSFAKRYKIHHLDWVNATMILMDGSLALVGVTTDTTTWNEDILLAHTDDAGEVGSCPHITPLSLNVTSTNISPLDVTDSIVIHVTPAMPHPTTATVTSLSLPANLLCSQEVSISEQEQGGRNGMLVFFNPISKTVTFSINEVQKGYVLEIYNEAGQLISKRKITKNKIILKTTGFAKGTYFYKVHPKDGTQVIGQGKFVVL